MRRTIAIVTLLLGSSVLAGATYARDVTETRFCKGLERRIDRLCDRHDASCDRILSGFEAVCGPFGTIFASPSAESSALDLLGEDHEIITVDEEFPARFVVEPVVVTAQDLDDPAFASLLSFARGAGKTIAIVDATQAEADRFANRFGASGGADCLPSLGSSRIELYGLQDSIDRTPALSSSYCLVGLTGLVDRDGELAVRRWLRERFAATPPAPSDPVGDDSGGIVSLATAKHCSFNDSNDPAGEGRQLTQDVYITGARSFTNAEDIYYVQNELQYTQGSSTDPNYGYRAVRFGAIGVPDFATGLSQSQPATMTQVVTSLSNNTTTTLNDSIGFNGSGPSATEGRSVTHGQTTTKSVPATTILNESANPLPAWTFTRQNTEGSTFGPETTWFWTVPWEDYADGGVGGTGRMQFTSELSMPSTDFVAEQPCSVPYPFEGIQQVGDPTISSVPSSVSRGGKFTITGSELYPGLVTGVLLGGNSVGDANFTAGGETAPGTGVFTIDVIVPGSQNLGRNTVTVQQTFNSTARFSNQPTIDVTR